MSENVTYKEMAKRLGVDPTTIRRLVERFGAELGITVQKGRANTSNAKWTHYLTREDADRLASFYETRHTRTNDPSAEESLQRSGYFYRCAPGRAKRWRVVPGSRASRGVESLWRFSAAGRPGPAKQNNAARPKARGRLGSPVAHTEGRGTTVIQLVPEALPNRVKIGYTDNLDKRLAEHQTAAPTARLLSSWSCKRSWDYAAMDSITREGCSWVLNEVFEGDPEGFVQHGNAFFGLMPKPDAERSLSAHSPLKSGDDSDENSDA